MDVVFNSPPSLIGSKNSTLAIINNPYENYLTRLDCQHTLRINIYLTGPTDIPLFGSLKIRRTTIFKTLKLTVKIPDFRIVKCSVR